MSETTLSKGDKIRVKGLHGEAIVVDRWTMPGEADARVKVRYIGRGRFGRRIPDKVEYEKNCVLLEAKK